MTEIARLRRFIRDAIIEDMQINPCQLAMKQTGKDINDASTRTLASQISADLQKWLRASCFIFGDTYHNQEFSEVRTILENNGFEIADVTAEENEIVFFHETFDMQALVLVQNNIVERIMVHGEYDIGPTLLDLQKISGVGFMIAEQHESNLKFTADLTLAFSAKFHVIRSLATDGSRHAV